jgi:hypothetical protein
VAAIVLMAAFLGGCGDSPTGMKAGSGDSTHTTGQTSGARSPLSLKVATSSQRLPAPISGEAVVSQGGKLLSIGGLDESGVSVSTVTELDPTGGGASSAGSLSQPLHDLAAAAVRSEVLVFGGGAAATTDEVQRLVPGASGEAVGKLPVPRSDLSAVTVGGAAYVLGGYDGEGTVGAILRTRDGSSFETVGQLRLPVRYSAVAAVDRTIYAIGGEEANGLDTSVIQAFDATTGLTSIVGRLQQKLAHASAVALAGRIYILGGRLDGSTSDQIARFDPSSGGTRRVGHLPVAEQNAAAGVVGGVAYLVGGLTSAETPLSSIVTLKLIALGG